MTGSDDGNRPRRLVLVVGTGTEVGKTWIAAQLLERWRRSGLVVAARKGAQSFAVGSGPTDAEVLAAASGVTSSEVCPEHRSYEIAMAPPMAAQVLGLAGFAVADLVAELRWPGEVDVGLVESAGGVRSPQADDGDAIDVARRLRCDRVLLVADAGLGTINAVRLCVDALGHAVDPRHLAVVLNRFDPGSVLHQENRRWLHRLLPADVLLAVADELDDLARWLAA